METEIILAVAVLLAGVIFAVGVSYYTEKPTRRSPPLQRPAPPQGSLTVQRSALRSIAASGGSRGSVNVGHLTDAIDDVTDAMVDGMIINEALHGHHQPELIEDSNYDPPADSYSSSDYSADSSDDYSSDSSDSCDCGDD